jgi:hypothetical protein
VRSVENNIYNLIFSGGKRSARTVHLFMRNTG